MNIGLYRKGEQKPYQLMTGEELVKRMRDRFLGWRLPENFNPDCGIHFDADAAKKLNPRNQRYEPIGTNLFSATQADEMVRYMLEGLESTPVSNAHAIQSTIIVQINHIRVSKKGYYSFAYILNANGKKKLGEIDGTFSNQTADAFRKVLKRGWAASLVLQQEVP